MNYAVVCYEHLKSYWDTKYQYRIPIPQMEDVHWVYTRYVFLCKIDCNSTQQESKDKSLPGGTEEFVS